MLTHDQALKTFSYSPDTGDLVWLVSPARNVPQGSLAGCKNYAGYGVVRYLKTHYRLHRLVWFYVYGAWPRGVIDHINGDKTDNRISNLRDVTHAVNSQNRHTVTRRNRSGYLGVYFRHGAYRAKLVSKGYIYELGKFNTPEEAHAAYMLKRRNIMEVIS